MTGIIALGAAPLAPLTHHMSVHILLMSLVAPLAALAFSGYLRGSRIFGSAGAVSAATVAQLAVLWGLHVPPVLEATLHSPAGRLAVEVVLLGTATWFWLTVLAQRGATRWRALAALLMTGKLFCLLAALLVFAPRHLYPEFAHATSHAVGMSPLSDQQLAGLLMIAACPATYVVAAVVITARWLKEIGADPAPASAKPGR